MIGVRKIAPEQNCPRSGPGFGLGLALELGLGAILLGGNFPRTVLIRKRHIKGGKHIAPMDFAEYLENQTFQRIAKFVMADFYEMDFMKGIVILIK